MKILGSGTANSRSVKEGSPDGRGLPQKATQKERELVETKPGPETVNHGLVEDSAPREENAMTDKPTVLVGVQGKLAMCPRTSYQPSDSAAETALRALPRARIAQKWTGSRWSYESTATSTTGSKGL